MTTCMPNECTYPNCPCPHQPLYRMQTNFEKPTIREQIALCSQITGEFARWGNAKSDSREFDSDKKFNV